MISDGTGSRRACVLVVDDEPQVRKTLAEIMDYAGHDVLLACDGLEAIEVFEREHERVTLVLLDLGMPRLGGMETLVRLRAIEPSVKVLLTTGDTSLELDGLELSERPDRVVSKPFRVKALLAVINEVLGRDS